MTRFLLRHAGGRMDWGYSSRLATGLALVLSVIVAAATPVLANHGDIHAYCNGNTPVVKSRPPGMEDVTVVCVRGLPEFMVTPPAPPTYNPITQARPVKTPPDFGGWVTVWLNGRPLRTPYDPVRGIQEPGAYISRSTGRVMMPVRFFTAAFGGGVEWSDEHGRVRLLLLGNLLQVWVGDRQSFVNGQIVSMDQPAILFQDRVFVPVRFLLEGFGAKVQWDQFNRSVRVQLDKVACVHTVYCGEAR